MSNSCCVLGVTTLDEVAEAFADAGAAVRTRLVFGKDLAAAMVATEEGCAAELDPPRPRGSVESSCRSRTSPSSIGSRGSAGP